MIKRAGTYELETRVNMKGGPGAVTLEKYFNKEDFGGPHVRVCSKLILPPGSGIGLHAHDKLILPPGSGIGLHAHETEDEVYIVVKGKGKVNDAGTVTEITVGDTVLTGKGNSHSVECVGDETLEIIALVVTY